MKNSRTESHSKYHDIFISYRREGGSAISYLLETKLKDSGFSVFLDNQSLGSGEFDAAISESICNTRNFLILLTPNYLKRCFEASEHIDVTYEEIKMALDKWNRLVKSGGVNEALNKFRIVPIFLGEDMVKHYGQYKETMPEVWNTLEAVLKHNGIKLTDITSIEDQIEKLIKSRLLRPTTQFVSSLIAESLNLANEEDELDANFGDINAKHGYNLQNLSNLFNAYLGMHSPSEIVQVRNQLSPLVHNRLMDLINLEGDSEIRKFENSLCSFKLSNIKNAYSEQRPNEIAHFGSRAKVIDDIKVWLQNGNSNDESSQDRRAYEDRQEIVLDLFNEAISLASNIRIRNDLRAAIDERNNKDHQFQNFSPKNWLHVEYIIGELFEHKSYTEINDFLRKLKKSKRDNEETSSKAVLAIDGKSLQRIHLEVWRRIKERYGFKDTKLTGRGNDSAGIKSLIDEIEKFLSYKSPYDLCEFDRSGAEFPKDDAVLNDQSSPRDRLNAAIRKITYGKGKEYKRFVSEFLIDSGVNPSIKTTLGIWDTALSCKGGQVLLSLSESGVSKKIKLFRRHWLLICNFLNIENNGTLEEIIKRVRLHVFNWRDPEPQTLAVESDLYLDDPNEIEPITVLTDVSTQ